MSTDSKAGLPFIPANEGTTKAPLRIKLAELLDQMREIEIDHDGKIYRLRLTQANKLILTA